jgi:hypothetical protein
MSPPRLTHRLRSLQHLENVGLRPPGYAQACLRYGNFDGRSVHFTPKSWLQVNEWVKTHKPPVQGAALRAKIGLGDMVAYVATPIARALHLDCIDPATGQLKPDSGCQKRKTWLNKFH